MVLFLPSQSSKASVPHKCPDIVTAAEAMTCIKSGCNVFVQGMAATPTLLTNAMTEYGKVEGLKARCLMLAVLYILVLSRITPNSITVLTSQGISVFHLHTEGPCAYVEEDCEGIFNTKR